MKYLRALVLSVLMTTLLLAGLALAQQQSADSEARQKADQKRAQERIAPVTPPEVQSSTHTAQQVADQANQAEKARHKQGLKTNPVPSPTTGGTPTKDNPNRDPAVDRGYQKNQQEIKDKRAAEKSKKPGS
jgi:hypothetical protein